MLILVLGGPGRQSPAVGDEGVGSVKAGSVPLKLTGFTSPFRTVTLAALRTGRIKAISVEEGQMAEVGAVTVEMDDETQLRRLEIASALAESTVEVELARVKLADAQAELERLEKTGSGGVRKSDGVAAVAVRGSRVRGWYYDRRSSSTSRRRASGPYSRRSWTN